MVKLADVAMLAAPSNRTRLYLYRMAEHNLVPAHVLYLEDPGTATPEKEVQDRVQERHLTGPYDLSRPIPQILEELDVLYDVVPCLNPNDDTVVSALAARPETLMIYSGPGGAILRKKVFATGKKFLHTHSGILPQFRGSTTVYYSLLAEGNCGATAFFLDEQIDTGPVIRRKRYPAPKDRSTIDLFYDPFIRADLLVEVLGEYAETGRMPLEPQDKSVGETYFIIHPVLKHLAILSHV